MAITASRRLAAGLTIAAALSALSLSACDAGGSDTAASSSGTPTSSAPGGAPQTSTTSGTTTPTSAPARHAGANLVLRDGTGPNCELLEEPLARIGLHQQSGGDDTCEISDPALNQAGVRPNYGHINIVAPGKGPEARAAFAATGADIVPGLAGWRLYGDELSCFAGYDAPDGSAFYYIEFGVQTDPLPGELVSLCDRRADIAHAVDTVLP